MLKKKIAAVVTMGVMLTGCLGTTVMAGNTTDTGFNYYVTSNYSYTGGRPKLDSTSTYVLLHSAPTRFVYCDVQGYKYGNWTDKTLGGNAVTMPLGEWEVRQTVYEDGYSEARLKFQRVTVDGYAAGLWSPDCVGSFPALN